jgi:FkbM family methyltransferase
MLTTRAKLKIARALSLGLRSTRRILGLPVTLQARRGGINWDLDLAEGIDLAIYLRSYQRISEHVRARVLRPGAAVVDIGANVGAFTLPLAAVLGEGGRVVAIEATDFAFEKLNRNLRLNPLLANRVTAVQALLVSDDAEQAPERLYSSWRLDAARGIDRHPSHQGVKMNTTGATSLTLDSLMRDDARLAPLLSTIEFIKLDVDGNELGVLRGARELLRSRRPSMLIEIAPYVQNEKPGRLTELLNEIRELGYRLEDPQNGSPIACDAVAITRLIPDGASMDLLCRRVA